MKVLVVDDAADMRFMLRAFLEDAGIEVDEARGGREALELLSGETEHDAVVLDQRMPDMTGIEVARGLAERRAAHPPLVLFSAYLHPDLRDEAEALGVTTVGKADLDVLVGTVAGVAGVAA